MNNTRPSKRKGSGLRSPAGWLAEVRRRSPIILPESDDSDSDDYDLYLESLRRKPNDPSITYPSNIMCFPIVDSSTSTGPPLPIPSFQEMKRGSEIQMVKCWGVLYSDTLCIYLYNDRFDMSRSLITRWESEQNRRIPLRVVSKISRHHFLLKLRCRRNLPLIVRITDKSVCGTYVNNRKIGRGKSITLFDGDTISIANLEKHTFRFRDFSNGRRIS